MSKKFSPANWSYLAIAVLLISAAAWIGFSGTPGTPDSGSEIGSVGDSDKSGKSDGSEVDLANGEGESNPVAPKRRDGEGDRGRPAEWTAAMESQLVELINTPVPSLSESYSQYASLRSQLEVETEFLGYPFFDAEQLDGLSPMAQQLGLQILTEGLGRMLENGAGMPGGTGQSQEYYESVLDSEDFFRVPITGFPDTPYLSDSQPPSREAIVAAQNIRLRYFLEYAESLSRLRTIQHLISQSAGAGGEVGASAQQELDAEQARLVAIRRNCVREVLTTLGSTDLPEFL